MLTAKEARELTFKNIIEEKSINSKLKEIFYLIEEAIKNKKYYIELKQNQHLDYYLIEYLRKLGYDIMTCDGLNYLIDWG